MTNPATSMPILTVDAGRSAAGRRGAGSHTAAAATPTVTRQALFTQAGITATRSIGELVEAAALLHPQPLPAGRGAVAVVSNAGGIGILAADACADAGLALPTLPTPLVAELLAVLPDGAKATNPVDTTAAVGPKELRACLDLLERSGSVDAVLLHLAPLALAADPEQEPLRALLSRPARSRIPVAVVLLDQDIPVRYLPVEGGQIPAYADPQTAARAIAHARDRAHWLAEPRGAELVVPDRDSGRAKHVVERFLTEHPTGGWLDPDGVTALMECYGIPLTTTIWAQDEHTAVLGAASLGQLGHDRKLALKAYWPEQVHKSDVGAVRTALSGEQAVRATYREFVKRFGGQLAGVVVQPMAAPGTELFAGVAQDAVFGPLVMFGIGGTTADLLDDRMARLAPLTDADVHAMTTGLRSAPLLSGYRGSPAVDPTAVSKILAGLSCLATDLPQLVEADLNPLIAGPKGVLCVDARVRLEPRHLFDPYLRRLRRPATPALGVLRRDDAAILADLEAVALAPDVGTVASTLRIGCERGRVTLDAAPSTTVRPTGCASGCEPWRASSASRTTCAGRSTTWVWRSPRHPAEPQPQPAHGQTRTASRHGVTMRSRGALGVGEPWSRESPDLEPEGGARQCDTKSLLYKWTICERKE